MDEKLEPVLLGDGVVVEKGDDIAPGCSDPGVLATRESLLLAILHHGDVGQRRGERGVQRGVVVDHQDDLPFGKALLSHRFHRGVGVVPTLLGVGADDDRDHAPARVERSSRCGGCRQVLELGDRIGHVTQEGPDVGFGCPLQLDAPSRGGGRPPPSPSPRPPPASTHPPRQAAGETGVTPQP